MFQFDSWLLSRLTVPCSADDEVSVGLGVHPGKIPTVSIVVSLMWGLHQLIYKMILVAQFPTHHKLSINISCWYQCHSSIITCIAMGMNTHAIVAFLLLFCHLECTCIYLKGLLKAPCGMIPVAGSWSHVYHINFFAFLLLPVYFYLIDLFIWETYRVKWDV